MGEPVIIKSGDPDNGLAMSDHVIEGEIAVGAQEHFYMETQRCMVIPQGEHDEIEVILSTQCLSPVQVRTPKNVFYIKWSLTRSCKRDPNLRQFFFVSFILSDNCFMEVNHVQ